MSITHVLAVPYVHQVYDTADDFTAEFTKGTNDEVHAFDGTAACAPTSAVMTLAYYQRIVPHPIPLESGTSHLSDFGYYVSHSYSYRYDSDDQFETSQVTHKDPSGNDAQGAWGYIWKDDTNWTGQGVSANLERYLEAHHLAADWHFTPTENDAKTLVQTEIDAGHPLIGRTYLTDPGHYVVIVGYEISDQGEFLYKVNDPFGKKPYPGGEYGDYGIPQPVTYTYSDMRLGDSGRGLLTTSRLVTPAPRDIIFSPSIRLTGAGSTLTILGTPGEDIIRIEPGSVVVNYNGQVLAHMDARPFQAIGGSITHIEVISGSGGGFFDFRDSPVPIIFFGGDGDEEIYGSLFNDVIYCGGGSDFVRGGDGADEIYAIAGSRDHLYGGAGDDVIHGSDGGDIISGGAGSDTIILGPTDQVQDATADDHVSIMNDRVVERRQNRINSRQQAEQNVASPDREGVKVSAQATPQVTAFTISQNIVTEGESVVFTVYAAEPNWARLVLFVDQNGDGKYTSGVDRDLGQFRGRNQDWRGQIGTAALGPGTFAVRAMLLPFSGTAAISNAITLTVEEQVGPPPPSMPDTVQIDPDDVLTLLPHRNGDVVVSGNTLSGNGQIDLWEITPRTGGGFALWTEGTTNTIVALYASNGNRIGSWDMDGGPGENGELVVTLAADTTYYFAVASETSAGGAYDLHVTGANQTVAGTINLSPSTHTGSLSGNFTGTHRLDYIQVVSPADATILDVSIDCDPSLELWARVADDQNNLVGFAQLNRAGADAILTDLPVQPTKTYYVTLYAMFGTEGSYTVNADFYPDESGLPTGLSPTPSANWLVPLHNGSLLVQGLSISDPAEFDYYLITPPSGGTGQYVFETHGTLDTRVGLYLRNSDSNSTLLAQDDDSGDGRNARLTATLNGGDAYLLVVRSGGGETGAYTLSMTSPALSVGMLVPSGLEATAQTGVNFIANNDHFHVFRVPVPTFANQLNINLNHVANASHPDWVLDASLRVTDASGNVLVTANAHGQQGNEAIPGLSVQPGRDVYITVAGEGLSIGQYQLFIDADPNYPVTSGNEFPVSTINADNEWPSVSRNANGAGVVVWRAGNVPDGAFSHNEIRGLRIGANGQPVGSEFRIDQGSISYPGHPAVAVAPDGSFVVAWNNLVRRFAANGSPLTSETTFTTDSVGELAIDADASGQFVVVWSTYSQPDPDGGIYARWLNASGGPTGSAIHVNAITTDWQDEPDVAFLSNGDWVVTWVSAVPTGGRHIDIHGRAFRGSSPFADEFTVNTDPSGNKWVPTISASSDGQGYVIAWINTGSTISARRFAENHAPLGDEFQATVSPGGTGVFDEPDVAMGSQGRFLVTAVASDGDGKGIIARQFNADGTPFGPELILNQVTASDQDTPSVSSNGDDKFLLAWRGPAGQSHQIRALEYTLLNVHEPELTVRDDSGDSSDASVDFGAFTPGDPAASRHVIIRNDGNADLTVTNLTISGPSAASFTLSDGANFVVSAGGSRTLTITFNPITVGAATASFVFNHNDTSDIISGDVDPQPMIVQLSANVIAPPALEVTVLPGTIREDDGQIAGAVRITRRQVSTSDLATPLVVTLHSTDETEATVPVTAVIPADELSAVVSVNAIDDFVNDGTQSVLLSAAATGFQTGRAVLLVQSVNHAPSLQSIPPKSVEAGETVSFAALASDPDAPANQLTFSLVGDYPLGAAIDASTGQFTWTTAANDAGHAFVIAIQVEDDGAPPLTYSTSVNITVTDTTPPTVTNVLVRGSTWANRFPSYSGYSIPIGSGAQLVTLPWMNIDQIKVVFSENVTIDKADLMLSGVNTTTYNVSGGTFTYDFGNFTATWTLPQAIGSDKLLLCLNADGADSIRDEAGNRLDGDWTNPPNTTPPPSTYPSGNGVAGGDFCFRFNLLPGDVNQDGAVNASDVAAVRGTQGATPDFGTYVAFHDYNGDGMVTSSDLIKVRNRQGTQLPEGELVLPLANLAALIVSPAVQAAASSGSLSDVSAPDTLSLAPEIAATKEDVAVESGVHPGGSSEPALPSLPNAAPAVQTHIAASGQLPSTTPLAARAVDAVLASWQATLRFSLCENRDSPQVVGVDREYWRAASYALAEWGRESSRFPNDLWSWAPKRRSLSPVATFASSDLATTEELVQAEVNQPSV